MSDSRKAGLTTFEPRRSRSTLCSLSYRNVRSPAECDKVPAAPNSDADDSDTETDTLRSISNIRSGEHIDIASDCSRHSRLAGSIEMDDFSGLRNSSNEATMCRVSSTPSPYSNSRPSSELLTPRMLEIPPKKICLRERTPTNRYKSIWTETLPSLPNQNATEVDYGGLPLEPNIIIIGKDPGETTNNPNAKHLQLINSYKQPTELNNTINNTYTVANFFTYAKRMFNVNRFGSSQKRVEQPTESKNGKEDDLEYFSDETVMRTINYSDYILPLKSLTALPDAKSTQNLLGNMAGEVFKSVEHFPNSSGDCDRLDNATRSFRNLSIELKNSSNEMGAAYGAKRFVPLTERRRQTLEVGYYNVMNSSDNDEEVRTYPACDDAESVRDESSSSAEEAGREATCCGCFWRDLIFAKRKRSLF